ncbi:hypothetical protein F966_02685 [Acinetobacter higginsii]|uniref:Msl2237 protein n=1 Tax=Acinetobacter higginsii TaxID=70347 RepID=N8XJ30_9GAMM|nr:DUF6500 family protein [Acinetobacter higginsii]ENV09039.1 hypothetical protein F966_02685 [Acinetobacter higginsii]
MKTELKAKIVHICDEKMAKKGNNVGLSFYAFFANKNDNPELLMEAAHWWIMEHRLDHFEKASKIKALVLAESN